MRKIISLFYTTLEEHRSLILLLSLAGLLVLLPVIVEMGGSAWITRLAFLTVMLAMTFRTSHYSRHVIANIAFVFAYCGTWFADVPTIMPHLLIVGSAITTIMVLFKSIFTTERVTIHVINSAVSIYLLMGVAWAAVFTVLFILNPNAYALSVAASDNAEPIYMFYFSFTTLTTVGYGDIVPLSLTAQIWAATEAVMGVLYLTVLMARLVSLYEVSFIRKRSD